MNHNPESLYMWLLQGDASSLNIYVFSIKHILMLLCIPPLEVGENHYSQS